MINLAFLKDNKWVLLGMVLAVILAIGFTTNSITDLVHPDKDKEIARNAKADKVIKDTVIDINSKLADSLEKQHDSSKIDTAMLTKYANEVEEKQKIVDQWLEDLKKQRAELLHKKRKLLLQEKEFKHEKKIKTIACKVPIVKSIKPEPFVDEKEAYSNKSAEYNIDAIYAVYNTIEGTINET